MTQTITRICLCTTILMPVWFSTAVQAQEIPSSQNVDVELQLLIDTSGSVSTSEYNLMMDGYANAFRSESVQNIILDDSNDGFGSIAVQTVMWSGQSDQRSVIDWTLLDSVDSIVNYADSLEAISRPYRGTTYVAEALEFGGTQFDNNGFTGTRNVIDISGDGYGFDYLYGNYYGFTGSNTSQQRDFALSNGVDTINGITIEGVYSQSGNLSLTEWYASDVVGGTNAFVMSANGFADFENALTTKLTAEIDGTYIPETATAAVDTAPAPAIGGIFSLMLITGGAMWWRSRTAFHYVS